MGTLDKYEFGLPTQQGPYGESYDIGGGLKNVLYAIGYPEPKQQQVAPAIPQTQPAVVPERQDAPLRFGSVGMQKEPLSRLSNGALPSTQLNGGKFPRGAYGMEVGKQRFDLGDNGYKSALSKNKNAPVTLYASAEKPLTDEDRMRESALVQSRVDEYNNRTKAFDEQQRQETAAKQAKIDRDTAMSEANRPWWAGGTNESQRAGATRYAALQKQDELANNLAMHTQPALIREQGETARFRMNPENNPALTASKINLNNSTANYNDARVKHEALQAGKYDSDLKLKYEENRIKDLANIRAAETRMAAVQQKASMGDTGAQDELASLQAQIGADRQMHEQRYFTPEQRQISAQQATVNRGALVDNRIKDFLKRQQKTKWYEYAPSRDEMTKNLMKSGYTLPEINRNF